MDVKRDALRELVIQAANIILANAQPENPDKSNSCNYLIALEDLDRLWQAMLELSEWENENLP